MLKDCSTSLNLKADPPPDTVANPTPAGLASEKNQSWTLPEPNLPHKTPA